MAAPSAVSISAVAGSAFVIFALIASVIPARVKAAHRPPARQERPEPAKNSRLQMVFPALRLSGTLETGCRIAQSRKDAVCELLRKTRIQLGCNLVQDAGRLRDEFLHHVVG